MRYLTGDSGKVDKALKTMTKLVVAVIAAREEPADPEDDAVETSESPGISQPDSVSRASMFDKIPVEQLAASTATITERRRLESLHRKQRAKGEIDVYKDHQNALKRAIQMSNSVHSAAATGKGAFKPELVRDFAVLEREEGRWARENRSLGSMVVETMRSHFKPGVFLGLVEKDCPNVVAAIRGFLAHGLSNARPERVFSDVKRIIDGRSCPSSVQELETLVTLSFISKMGFKTEDVLLAELGEDLSCASLVD